MTVWFTNRIALSGSISLNTIFLLLFLICSSLYFSVIVCLMLRRRHPCLHHSFYWLLIYLLQWCVRTSHQSEIYSQDHVLWMSNCWFPWCWFQNIFVCSDQFSCFSLCFIRNWQVYRHLISIEVSVKCRTNSGCILIVLPGISLF